MKKLIARILNAIRDRWKKKRSGKIEVGKTYLVSHTHRGERIIKITNFNELWASGMWIDSLGREVETEIILMRTLCTFKEVRMDNG
jgi:hypothetical protein